MGKGTMLTADDILSDLAGAGSASTRRSKPKGGRRARARSSFNDDSANTNTGDRFGDLDSRGGGNLSSFSARDEAQTYGTSQSSNSNVGGKGSNTSSSFFSDEPKPKPASSDLDDLFSSASKNRSAGKGTAKKSNERRSGRRREIVDDDDDSEEDFGPGKSSASNKGYTANINTSAPAQAPKRQEPQPKKEEPKKKEEDEFGGFDMSGLYFGGSGTNEDDADRGVTESFNPFFGGARTQNKVVNQATRTRQLDMNKKSVKKNQPKKNTTKSTGPKWNRPTFDFEDDDDLDLDEEDLGEGTIGNGNKVGIEKPELHTPGSDAEKWTDGIEPAKVVKKPKKPKKKKRSTHLYDDSDDDDDGIPSF